MKISHKTDGSYKTKTKVFDHFVNNYETDH